MNDEPMLGLATTEQLLRELIARFTVSGGTCDVSNALILAEMVGGLDGVTRDYRTVVG